MEQVYGGLLQYLMAIFINKVKKVNKIKMFSYLSTKDIIYKFN